MTGLTLGQTYFITVTAYDTSPNESGYSNEVSGPATDGTQTFTVTTNPSGLQVVVDGTTYTAPQTFSWVVGSSHTLSVSSPQSGELQEPSTLSLPGATKELRAIRLSPLLPVPPILPTSPPNTA